MSIKELSEDFVAKRKEVTVEHKGKSLVFTAFQLPYLDALDLAVAAHRGKNEFAMQIAKSIQDENGEKLTYDQALKLPDDIAKVFWEASAEVNKREEELKN